VRELLAEFLSAELPNLNHPWEIRTALELLSAYKKLSAVCSDRKAVAMATQIARTLNSRSGAVLSVPGEDGTNSSLASISPSPSQPSPTGNKASRRPSPSQQ
jgi:hypothetical protein